MYFAHPFPVHPTTCIYLHPPFMPAIFNTAAQCFTCHNSVWSATQRFIKTWKNRRQMAICNNVTKRPGNTLLSATSAGYLNLWHPRTAKYDSYYRDSDSCQCEREEKQNAHVVYTQNPYTRILHVSRLLVSWNSCQWYLRRENCYRLTRASRDYTWRWPYPAFDAAHRRVLDLRRHGLDTTKTPCVEVARRQQTC